MSRCLGPDGRLHLGVNLRRRTLDVLKYAFGPSFLISLTSHNLPRSQIGMTTGRELYPDLTRARLVLLCAALGACEVPDAPEEPLPPLSNPSASVDLFIGTGGTGSGSSNTFPGPVAPWGMVQPGPDTANADGSRLWFNHASGYHYDDELILGFSQTRLQGVSTPDLGAISIMPSSGGDPAVLATPEGRWSSFSHEDEEAQPGYYAVRLDGDGPRVEVTATRRVSHYRIDELTTLVFDLSSAEASTEVLDASLHVDTGAGVVEGWTAHSGRFSGHVEGGIVTWFHARLSAPITGSSTWNGDELSPGATEASGAQIGAVLDVAGPVEVRIGVSYVDLDGARANLEAEIPDGQTFDTTRAVAQQRWADVLGAMQMGGGGVEDRKILATSLYHSFVMPTLVQDVDGRYRGLDHAVHQADFSYHSMFSLWDTYRTTHPLLSLIQPTQQIDLVRSLLQMGHDGGYVPRWPLGDAYTNVTVGTPADIMVADTALRGLAGFDPDAALDSLLRSAAAPVAAGHDFGGRAGIEDYLQSGYVPAEAVNRSVSRTLEFAVADHALGRWAEQLGRPEAGALLQRGQSYRRLWNPSLQVFDGRRADGSWVGVDPEAYEGDDLYYGGNAMQYAWFAPQDMGGLIELNGGPEPFSERLDGWLQATAYELEDSGLLGVAPPLGYYHGNEPDLHVPWLFVAAGRPDLAQRWVRWAADTHYLATPDGIMGNEDAGALSSWYVLAALGIYPVPGSDLWLLGAPRLPVVELAVEGGVLRIEAPQAGPQSPYVSGLTWNGEPWDHPGISHAQLAAGGVLRFTLAAEPAEWGRDTQWL